MDAGSLARSVISRVISVPVNFYYGLVRTMQDMKLSDGRARTQQRNFRDDVRLYHVVRREINHRSMLGDIVRIIIEDALNDLPDTALEKIHDAIMGKATSVASRTATQLAISSWLESKVVSGITCAAFNAFCHKYADGRHGCTGRCCPRLRIIPAITTQ